MFGTESIESFQCIARLSRRQIRGKQRIVKGMEWISRVGDLFDAKDVFENIYKNSRFKFTNFL